MKNVTLTYKGHLTKVKTAVSKANEILAAKQFYNMIRGYKQFDQNELSPETISQLLEDSGHRITVTVNWLFPIPRPSHKTITISAWDFSGNLAAGVNELIKGTVSSIDRLYAIQNNKPSSEYSTNQTAPWVIGSIAEILLVK